MNLEKLMQLLGLAQRAREQTSGTPQVLSAIRQQKAKLVLIANDASENTKKQIISKCEYYSVPVSSVLNQAQITQAIGMPRLVVAVTNQGFAKKMKTLIEGMNNDM